MIHLREDLKDAFTGNGAFENILCSRGEIFREQKNRKTLRITHDGKGYFLKIHRKTGLGEIIKNLLQMKWPVVGAQNELRAIERLEEIGVKTMKVAGFGIRGIPPAWVDSFIITEEIENTVSLEDFCRNWPSNPPDFHLKLTLLCKIAGIMRCLHRNGINHRDCYICHFLLDPSSTENKQNYEDIILYIIDLHRVQLRKLTPFRWIIKDLAGLYFSSMDIGLTERDLFRFMKSYSGKPLRKILKEEQGFWNQVSRRAVSLYVKHFNRMPNMPHT